MNVRAVAAGSSNAAATFNTTTATKDDHDDDDADPTRSKADPPEALPLSPSDRVGEETAEAGAMSGEKDAGEGAVAATAAGGSAEGGGGGGSAGLAISDEYYESEVDVLGVSGQLTAIFLGRLGVDGGGCRA